MTETKAAVFRHGILRSFWLMIRCSRSWGAYRNAFGMLFLMTGLKISPDKRLTEGVAWVLRKLIEWDDMTPEQQARAATTGDPGPREDAGGSRGASEDLTIRGIFVPGNGVVH
jgi:hypothetical protein